MGGHIQLGFYIVIIYTIFYTACMTVYIYIYSHIDPFTSCMYVYIYNYDHDYD